MEPKAEGPIQAAPPTTRNLSRWFWGTIVVLAILSVLITLLAKFRHQDVSVPEKTVAPYREEINKKTELPRTILEKILRKANEAGLQTAKGQIAPLLDAAYAPVYDAIPAYTDFHYSLPGEYLELTEAAIGDLGGAIQARLFSGHEERLDRAMYLLDESFGEGYREQLERSLAETLSASPNNLALGPLTESAIEGAKTRIKVTAPVAGLIMIGGAVSLKAASTLVAKKIATKIGFKAVAKSGAKWAAAASGAGGGAIVCSWAGPVAGLCAAGGAVIAWVAVDIAVLNLDELMNRDEFEDNLRVFIDEDKSARRRQLEEALDEKFDQVRIGTTSEISNFTLKQLTGPKQTELCSVVTSLINEYAIFRTNVSKRRPDSIREVRSRLVKSSGDPVLAPLVDEIERNLDSNTSKLTITQIKISGNVPEGFREDRDISARISLSDENIKFNRMDASKDSGFVLERAPDISLDADSVERIQLAIEQHRRIFPNRQFGGTVDIDIFDAMSDGNGLEGSFTLTVPIAHDYDAQALGEMDRHMPGGESISIEFLVAGEPLPRLVQVPGCP